MIIRATAPTKALMPNPDSSIKKHLIYTKNQQPLRCRIPPFDKNCPLKSIEILQNPRNFCGSFYCSKSSDSVFWTHHNQKHTASMQNPNCKNFYVSWTSGSCDNF